MYWFFFVTLTSHSQVLISLLLGDRLNSERIEFGLIGGANLSKINGLETNSMYPAFNLGFYFDIRMVNNWYFHTGIMVKYDFGVSDLTLSDRQTLRVNEFEYKGKYNQIVNGFQMPFLIQYQFKNYLYVEAGPELAWHVRSYSKFISDSDDPDIRIRDNNSDLLNWFNGAFAVGAGYQLLKGKGWDIGCRYSHAFTDVFKNVLGSKNRGFLIYAKVPIGASSVKNKKANRMLPISFFRFKNQFFIFLSPPT